MLPCIGVEFLTDYETHRIPNNRQDFLVVKTAHRKLSEHKRLHQNPKAHP
jgi:hypothetical protein